MDDQLLDTNELAQILNFARSTIYRMIRRGDIKAIRIGQFWRVSRRELERLLSEAEARASSPSPGPTPKRRPAPKTRPTGTALPGGRKGE